MQEQPPSDPPRREPAAGARRSRSTKPTFTPPPTPERPTAESAPTTRTRRAKAAPGVLFQPPDPARVAPRAAETGRTPAPPATPPRPRPAADERPIAEERPAADPAARTSAPDEPASPPSAPTVSAAAPAPDEPDSPRGRRAGSATADNAPAGPGEPASESDEPSTPGTSRAVPTSGETAPTAPAEGGTTPTRAARKPAGPAKKATPAKKAGPAKKTAAAKKTGPVAKTAEGMAAKADGAAEKTATARRAAPANLAAPAKKAAPARRSTRTPAPVQRTGEREPTDDRLSGRTPEKGRRPRLLDHPGFAPELLALGAVDALAPGARDWVERVRARYPNADADGLARLATRRFVRFAGTGGALAAGAGLLAPVAELAALLWAQAGLVLHLAAVYGRDPGHPDRVAELLVLAQVHPDEATARAALDAVRSTDAPEGGPWSRAAEAAWRLATPLAARAGGWLGLRWAARLLPGAALLTAVAGDAAATERLAARAIARYRPTRVG